ncbi:MAG TPA: carbohydrate-binding module family 20 domain-containing protein, partial [Chitinophagaceae bacterium]
MTRQMKGLNTELTIDDMKLQFYLRFHTQFGQSLWISGNADELGNEDASKALPMEYLNDEFWEAQVEIKRKDLPKNIRYKYLLKNEDGELVGEWGDDRLIDVFKKELHEVQLVDTWNHAGEYENVFFTLPFKNVLLNTSSTKGKAKKDKNYT